MVSRWQRSRKDGAGGGRLILWVDGAIRPGVTGLGVVVRDQKGRVVTWQSKALSQTMTCNEAEYEALLFGLETVQDMRPAQVEVRTDSQVVANQMLGLFAVRNSSLRRLHARARAIVAALGTVEIVHVPRLRNRLADALANEAAEGSMSNDQ
jgi:ribonuclease HI